MIQQQRRLATIMVTDMVGYSALAQRDEALALDLLAEQRRLLRTLFAASSGREIDAVGDGFLVEFASAVEAARCAIEIQRSLFERNAGLAGDRRIEVRIGLHLGDVVVRDERVQGDGVNIAARIEPLAPAGGICLSEDVVRQIQNKIETPLRKLGKGELKNIRLPVEIYRVVLPWEQGGWGWGSGWRSRSGAAALGGCWPGLSRSSSSLRWRVCSSGTRRARVGWPCPTSRRSLCSRYRTWAVMPLTTTSWTA